MNTILANGCFSFLKVIFYFTKKRTEFWAKEVALERKPMISFLVMQLC